MVVGNLVTEKILHNVIIYNVICTEINITFCNYNNDSTIIYAEWSEYCVIKTVGITCYFNVVLNIYMARYIYF